MPPEGGVIIRGLLLCEWEVGFFFFFKQASAIRKITKMFLLKDEKKNKKTSFLLWNLPTAPAIYATYLPSHGFSA